MAAAGPTFRTAFMRSIERHPLAGELKAYAQGESLGEWTRVLTAMVVEVCAAMGWHGAAKGHRGKLLPVRRSEYLALDVTAFDTDRPGWTYPTAIFELENRREPEYVGYALWKLLCVDADLRVLICYRPTAGEAGDLIRYLRDEVLRAMDLSRRGRLHGETLVVVGSRGDAGTFPNGFFRWWSLDARAGALTLR